MQNPIPRPIAFEFDRTERQLTGLMASFVRLKFDESREWPPLSQAIPMQHKSALGNGSDNLQARIVKMHSQSRTILPWSRRLAK